ncbi:hypothetical protein CAPTEDRAFT_192107 [Capitella teleta]|uniref:Uncharacterized protein n=1 Tax=Capitella teleta TaxID=283909 RepID=R7TRR2_CAPTE|nr:hypothetical protein CAPTEDRAFT_192107 [Capitella teleta]|eukprot:ELT96299.1 hypothetical protein CAPTEDRAFT_192107 [Capitella teleta]
MGDARGGVSVAVDGLGLECLCEKQYKSNDHQSSASDLAPCSYPGLHCPAIYNFNVSKEYVELYKVTGALTGDQTLMAEFSFEKGCQSSTTLDKYRQSDQAKPIDDAGVCL